MLTKNEIKEKLKNTTLIRNEFWVSTGAALVLYGIKKETRDIDVGCTTKMMDLLIDQGNEVLFCEDGTRKVVLQGDIEIFENWIEDYVVLVENIPVLTLNGIIKIKQKLGREKDFRDIEDIKRYLTTHKQKK